MGSFWEMGWEGLGSFWAPRQKLLLIPRTPSPLSPVRNRDLTPALQQRLGSAAWGWGGEALKPPRASHHLKILNFLFLCNHRAAARWHGAVLVTLWWHQAQEMINPCASIVWFQEWPQLLTTLAAFSWLFCQPWPCPSAKNQNCIVELHFPSFPSLSPPSCPGKFPQLQSQAQQLLWVVWGLDWAQIQSRNSNSELDQFKFQPQVSWETLNSIPPVSGSRRTLPIFSKILRNSVSGRRMELCFHINIIRKGFYCVSFRSRAFFPYKLRFWGIFSLPIFPYQFSSFRSCTEFITQPWREKKRILENKFS